ncbi:hypothetical protein [Pseudoalteromonas sp. S3178]|uniref:hypothetical protein n=1 Tax=Pseudoalteromonas sp. S3178 TaxID=579532 RepID=UPI0014874B27|nr:hypothetical protein [Pseudoalteromonas sp. S3178]
MDVKVVPIYAGYVYIINLNLRDSVILKALWVTNDQSVALQLEEVEAWVLTGTRLQG